MWKMTEDKALYALGSLVWTLGGCGGAAVSPANPGHDPAPSGSAAVAETAPAAPSPGTPSEDAPAAQSAMTMPEKCAEGSADGVCAPPRAFVAQLCEGYAKPEWALAMFGKSTPWTRAYMNRNIEAWYTTGRQSTKAQLVFDEEVIVINHPKAASGGMVVGNGASPYDILRWDGVCASLGGEEVTLKRPPSPKRPSIPWQHLDASVKDALLADTNVAKADASRRKECKGTTGLGMMSPACVKADDKLSASIVDYVLSGGSTPLPKAGNGSR